MAKKVQPTLYKASAHSPLYASYWDPSSRQEIALKKAHYFRKLITQIFSEDAEVSHVAIHCAGCPKSGPIHAQAVLLKAEDESSIDGILGRVINMALESINKKKDPQKKLGAIRSRIRKKLQIAQLLLLRSNFFPELFESNAIIFYNMLTKTSRFFLLQMLHKLLILCNAKCRQKHTLSAYICESRAQHPALIAQFVAKLLQSNLTPKKVLDFALKTFNLEYGGGIRVLFAGRVGHTDKAKTSWAQAGYLPIQTLLQPSHFTSYTEVAQNGVLGIKIWVHLLPRK